MHVVDHPILIGHNGWYYLTNHMVMMILAALLMLIIFPLITKPYRDGKLVNEYSSISDRPSGDILKAFAEKLLERV